MYSIRTWYNRNAKIPLVCLIIAVLGIQTFYFAFVIRENERRYDELINSIIQVSGVALMQKNRVMLESLLYTVSENPSFIEFFICEGNEALVSFPIGKSLCEAKTKNLFSKIDRHMIPGFSNYSVLAVVPKLKLPEGYSFVAATTILISIISIFLVFLVSSRFENEILNPILSDFDEYKSGQIFEFDQLRVRRNKVLELEREKVFANLARQVAHDIRSPASALKIFIAKKAAKFEPEENSILSNAVERIVNIADDLLTRSSQSNLRNEVKILTVVEATKKVIAEKFIITESAEFNLKIDSIKDISASIKVNLNEWERMVSNIFENSVQSRIGQKVKVDVRFSSSESTLFFECSDNGPGISKAVLRTIKTVGGSHGKLNGNGLGLSHFKNFISQHHGDWDITSEIDIGTSIRLSLPLWTDLQNRASYS